MFKVIAHTPRGKFEAKFNSESREKIYNLCREEHLGFISFRGINNSDEFVLREDVFKKTVFEFVDLEDERDFNNS